MAERKDAVVQISRDTLKANLAELARRRYHTTEFAAVCGLSTPTMRKKLANPMLLTVFEVHAIADLTHTNASDLLTRLLREM